MLKTSSKRSTSSWSPTVRDASYAPDNDDERVLLKPISYEPCHIDELIRESGLPTTTVSSTLAMMELKGMIKQLGDAICFSEIERQKALLASKMNMKWETSTFVTEKGKNMVYTVRYD